MKTRVKFSSLSVRTAFTLPELLVAITIFSFVLTGVVFAHLYGLSMFRITETTLNAADDARKVVGKMTDEIRMSKKVSICKVNNGVFSSLLNGELQQGNSLIIYPTTNNTPFHIYFVNPADKTFRRTVATSSGTNTVTWAESVTNSVVFTSEDYLGNVLMNNSPRVIHFRLEFYKAKSRRQVADYYKLETSVARRSD